MKGQEETAFAPAGRCASARGQPARPQRKAMDGPPSAVRRYAHRLPCWGYSHLKNAGWAADASLRSLSASRQARKAAHSRLVDRLHWETAVNGSQQSILRRQWGQAWLSPEKRHIVRSRAFLRCFSE